MSSRAKPYSAIVTMGDPQFATRNRKPYARRWSTRQKTRP